MPQISSKPFFDNLLQQITVYESQEAKEIVFWLMEFYLGLKKIDILSDISIENNPHPRLSQGRGAKSNVDWNSIIERINSNEPIQYILGETEFFGRKFLVNSNVLIPRPETEELVQLVIESSRQSAVGNGKPAVVEEELRSGTPPVQNSEAERRPFRTLLDLGTGSGCIAISLAKELPDFQVFAWDISEKALEIAQKNAELNNANVIFEKVDILNHSSAVDNSFSESSHRIHHSPFTIITSNPPYVTKNEIDFMQKNVLDFEPHLALFVENNDPLVFYKAIAEIAHKRLIVNGLLIVEINETLGKETTDLFIKKGFSEVEIIKDIHQKDRFVRARLRKKD